MSQNLKLGQYKSLNANARIFEIGSAEKYMNFLKLFKPFYIDKYCIRRCLVKLITLVCPC